jgi:hypothetical protein
VGAELSLSSSVVAARTSPAAARGGVSLGYPVAPNFSRLGQLNLSLPLVIKLKARQYRPYPDQQWGVAGPISLG